MRTRSEIRFTVQMVGRAYSLLCLDSAINDGEREEFLACETDAAGLDGVGRGESSDDGFLLLRSDLERDTSC